MKEVVIIEGIRTAVGRRKGKFAQTRPDELAAIVLEKLIERAGIDKRRRRGHHIRVCLTGR